MYLTMTHVENVLHRLKQMNTYLKYFPGASKKNIVMSITDEYLIEPVHNVKSLEYNHFYAAEQ